MSLHVETASLRTVRGPSKWAPPKATKSRVYDALCDAVIARRQSAR